MQIGGKNFQFRVRKSSSSSASTGCITYWKSSIRKTKDSDYSGKKINMRYCSYFSTVQYMKRDSTRFFAWYAEDT